MGGGTPGHVLFVSRLTFFQKSYLALEKYVAVSRKNRGIGGTGQESRKLINSAPTATGFIFWSRAAICNPPSPSHPLWNFEFQTKHYLIQFIATLSAKILVRRNGQEFCCHLLIPIRVPEESTFVWNLKKNRSKISNFTAVLKYWEFSSRMRKHTTPIQMVQATSDAITFCEKEKRKEILSERTFLFLWKYIFMTYFNNITKEIFRENAGEIKIRITHQKWFHPIFRVSCTLKKRGV